MAKGGLGTIVLTLGSLILQSCASGTLGRFSDSDHLPQDLPKEIQDKFIIQEEVPADAATPLLDQSAAAESAGKKTGKKGRRTPTPRATRQAFFYPMRRGTLDPIWVNERMSFDISFLGVPAAQFIFQVLPHKRIGPRKVYHFKGLLTSYSVFNLVYRLNDQVESYVDFDGLFSHRYRLLQDESGQSRDQLELYDSEKRQIFYWNRHKGKDGPMSESREFAPIQPFVQDYLSAAYVARTFGWKEGAVFEFPMAHEKKQFDGVISFVRRENLSTVLGRLPAIVVRPQIREGGQLKGNGEIFIWISDDDRRRLLRLEARVRIGTIVASLTSYEPGTPPELVQAEPTPAPSPIEGIK